MQKWPLLVLPIAFMTLACSSSHDDDGSPAPQPVSAPTPVVTPTPDPNAFKLKPSYVTWDELPADHGFTAVYESINTFMTLLTKGPMTVLARPDHIQIRVAGLTEILDCRFDQTGATPSSIKHIVEGVEKPVDAWNALACLSMRERLRPVKNLNELCEEYSCNDETMGPFNTIHITYGGGLWVEKESSLVVREGDALIMKSKSNAVPQKDAFDF